MQRYRRQVLLVAAGLVAVLAAVSAWLVVGIPGRVDANLVRAGLDFSISADVNADGIDDCDSTSGPTTCTIAPGATFTLDLNLNSIPAGLVYDAYDSTIMFSGVIPDQDSVEQAWPDCVFDASSFMLSDRFGVGCAVGINAGHSSYVGVLYHVDISCPDAAPSTPSTLTLRGDFPDNRYTTFVVGGVPGGDLQKNNQEGTNETLTITCGAPTPTPTPTQTAGGATDTPTPTPTITSTPASTSTPTVTPTPTVTFTLTPTRTPTITPTFTPSPTPTRRRPHSLLGDVDGDGYINSVDALWVLQYDVELVAGVPIPEAADMNGDGFISPIDALFILWVDIGVILPL